ncbi:hypothetical protein BDV25DRAFT_165244 [Aspergillus avenaceus]|uniref:Uncharacterized protein n=1 Tax=Aspergillus avenaceus TaxID=36643 RepID=A0A5N6TFR0_ASPAV|nr:hypothetical protein BDV25DRAFT_165244 [Aspergillus avenaceus]
MKWVLWGSIHLGVQVLCISQGQCAGQSLWPVQMFQHLFGILISVGLLGLVPGAMAAALTRVAMHARLRILRRFIMNSELV